MLIVSSIAAEDSLLPFSGGAMIDVECRLFLVDHVRRVNEKLEKCQNDAPPKGYPSPRALMTATNINRNVRII